MSKPIQPKPMPTRSNTAFAIIAGILSFVLPGAGQLLARKLRRAILMLASYATIIGLLVWRFIEAAPRDSGFLPIFQKAIHLEPMLGFIFNF